MEPPAPVAIDHLGFGTHNLAATRAFYEGQLGFAVAIHERMLVAEGGHVEHMFFDCGDGLRLEFTTRLSDPGEADRDPERRQFPVALALFRDAALPSAPA